jgi:hypothetical protein
MAAILADWQVAEVVDSLVAGRGFDGPPPRSAQLTIRHRQKVSYAHLDAKRAVRGQRMAGGT